VHEELRKKNAAKDEELKEIKLNTISQNMDKISIRSRIMGKMKA